MDIMLGRKENDHSRDRDTSLVPDHLTRAEDALAKLVQEAAQAEVDSRFATDRTDASLEPRIAASDLDVTPHPIGNEPPADRPPRHRRRVRRAMMRFLFAVAVGVAGTLAWQSYGRAAREMLAVYVPALAPSSSGMLAVVPAAEPERVEAAAPPTTSAAAASDAEPAAPLTAISPEVLQRITQMAYDLAAMRKSMDQLTTNQDQMSRTMARLQSADEEIKAKLAAASPVPPPPAAAQAPAHKPPAAKPAQSARTAAPQGLAPGPRPLWQSVGPSPPPRATAP